jgi:hypothetical protein
MVYEHVLVRATQIALEHASINPKYPRYRGAYVELNGVGEVVTVFSSSVVVFVAPKA